MVTRGMPVIIAAQNARGVEMVSFGCYARTPRRSSMASLVAGPEPFGVCPSPPDASDRPQ